VLGLTSLGAPFNPGGIFKCGSEGSFEQQRFGGPTQNSPHMWGGEKHRGVCIVSCGLYESVLGLKCICVERPLSLGIGAPENFCGDPFFGGFSDNFWEPVFFLQGGIGVGKRLVFLPPQGETGWLF